MPFVRFSRDKRGYEYVFLVDVPSRQTNASRARVLYWYRTPPGLKVGRRPFDEAARRALEGQYPDLSFDWKQIVETPMPPPELTINWRERRREERAAKRARLHGELEEAQAESQLEEGSPHGSDETESGRAEAVPTVTDVTNVMDATDVAPHVTKEAETSARTSGRRRRRRRGSRARRQDVPLIQASDVPAAEAQPRPEDGTESKTSDPDDPFTDQDG